MIISLGIPMDSVCDCPQDNFLPHSFRPFHIDTFFHIKKGGERGRVCLLIHKGNSGVGGDPVAMFILLCRTTITWQIACSFF